MKIDIGLFSFQKGSDSYKDTHKLGRQQDKHPACYLQQVPDAV